MKTPSIAELAAVTAVGIGLAWAAKKTGVAEKAPLAVPALLALALVACAQAEPGPRPSPSPPPVGAEKLQHLVFIVQENRSFDHYFGDRKSTRLNSSH